jgi:lysophospholipase L1-like esterase
MACINYYDSGGAFLGQTLGTVISLAAGETRRLYCKSAVTMAGTAFVAAGIRMYQVQDFTIGATLTLSKVTLSQGIDIWPYFDGDSPYARWEGTAGYSASVAGVTSRSGSIACWGDSHTAGNQGGGTPYPEQLGALLGVDVYNGGRGGETASGIALRQGSLDFYVTVASNTIPTSGSVGITAFTSGTEVWRDDASWDFAGSIAGVPGILNRAITTGTWTFTRSVAGSTVTVKPETPFKSHNTNDIADLYIVFAGSNIPNQTSVLRNVQAMTDRITGFGKRFLVVGLLTTSSETSGTANYITVHAINDALKAKYGALFVDLSGYMVRNGLALAGITPTGPDNTAVAGDTIPPSLRAVDGVHLTDVGRGIEAAFYKSIIDARGLLT